MAKPKEEVAPPPNPKDEVKALLDRLAGNQTIPAWVAEVIKRELG